MSYQFIKRRSTYLLLLASIVLCISSCNGFWTPRTNNTTTSKFAFVANANFSGTGAGTVSTFTVNSTTGALTAAANVSAASTGSTRSANSPVDIVTTAGKYVYTANDGGSVSAFTWDTSSGQLTAITGSPFATHGSNPTALIVDRTGKYLYVAEFGSNDIDGFTINTSTGALTRITGSPWTLTNSPSGLAIHPTLNVLYAAIDIDGVATFNINSDGSLTFKNNKPPLTGGSSQAVLISKNGNFAYVTNGLSPSGGVEAWRLDSTTGLITTAVNATPYAAHDTPLVMVTDPTGSFLIVMNKFSDDVSFYSMNTSTGTLSALNSGNPINVVTNSSSTPPALSNISIDPTGQFVYVTVLDSTPGVTSGAGIPGVVLFKLVTTSSATLTKVPVSSTNDGVQAGNNPSGIVLP